MDSTTFGVGGGKEFEVAPAGQDVLVCVDGMDLGHKVEEFVDDKADSPTKGQKVKKLTRKYALVFQTSKTDSEGRRFCIVREFTASMAKSANLRKFVAAWLGREIGEDEAKTFDPASLYGRNGLGTLIRKTAQASGKQRAELQALAPMFPGIPEIAPAGYERPKFLQMRKDDYAKEAAAFMAAQTGRAASATRTADAAVAAMVGSIETDDLPF